MTPASAAMAPNTARDCVVHHTRHVPLCISCRWMRTDQRGANREVATCNHPATQVSIVTGEPSVECWAMRHGAGIMQDATQICGPHGTLWEPMRVTALSPRSTGAAT